LIARYWPSFSFPQVDATAWISLPETGNVPNRGENIKSANKFETLGPETDKNGDIIGKKTHIVSIIDDSPRPKDFAKTYQRDGTKRTAYHIMESKAGIDGELLIHRLL
jgi:hypothetical protein